MSYIALSSIKHNGVVYEKDQEVTGLSDEQAQSLIEAGVIESDEEAAPAAPAAPESPAPEKKQEAKTEDKKVEAPADAETAPAAPAAPEAGVDLSEGL